MVKFLILIILCYNYIRAEINDCELPSNCRIRNKGGSKPEEDFNSIKVDLECSTLSPKYNYSNLMRANDECELKKLISTLKIHLVPLEKEYIEEDFFDFLKVLDFTLSSQNLIMLENVKGFRLKSAVFFESERTIHFTKTDFKFFDLNGWVVESCEQFNGSGTNGFFSGNYFDSVTLYEVDYTTPICRLIFKNSFIRRIEVNFLVESYLKTNMIRFDQSSDYEWFWPSNEVVELVIRNSYRVDLRSNFIDPEIFSQISRLDIGGTVNSIEMGLFKSLSNLRKIRIPADYFTDLIRRQGITWIKDLNSNVNLNMSSRRFEYSSGGRRKMLMALISLTLLRENYLNSRFQMAYDEDLCLFKDFPFDQLIVVWFDHPQDEEAPYLKHPSCATLWLSQYYMQFKAVYSESDLNALNRSDFASCDFDKRLKLCKKVNFVSSENKPTDFTSLDFMIVSEFTLIIFSRSISLIGIVLSVLTIIVLLKGNGLKENQYHYMVIYSMSNMLIFMIQITSLLNECQFPFGIFCSGVNRSLSAQYFKIIAVEYFTAFFRLLSNLIYVAYALNRLSLVGKEHNPVTKFISELDIRIYIGVSILISGSLSVVKALRFEVNSNSDETWYNSSPVLSELLKVKWTGIAKYKVIFILDFAYEILNCVLFVIVCFAIDMSLIGKLKRELKERSIRFREQTEMSQEKVRKENDESIRRVTLMVVLNTIVNVLCKLPTMWTITNDLRLLISGVDSSDYFSSSFEESRNIVSMRRWYSFPYSMRYFCYGERSCEILQNAFNCLFLLSLSVNFFFLKYFDKNFLCSYENFTEAKKKKPEIDYNIKV